MNKTTLKVALINNMNNNFFVLARYLNDLGFDCHLFLISENKWHPSEDTADFNLYKPWIHSLNCNLSLNSFINNADYFLPTDVEFLKTNVHASWFLIGASEDDFVPDDNFGFEEENELVEDLPSEEEEEELDLDDL